MEALHFGEGETPNNPCAGGDGEFLDQVGVAAVSRSVAFDGRYHVDEDFGAGAAGRANEANDDGAVKISIGDGGTGIAELGEADDGGVEPGVGNGVRVAEPDFGAHAGLDWRQDFRHACFLGDVSPYHDDEAS